MMTNEVMRRCIPKHGRRIVCGAAVDELMDDMDAAAGSDEDDDDIDVDVEADVSAARCSDASDGDTPSADTAGVTASLLPAASSDCKHTPHSSGT